MARKWWGVEWEEAKKQVVFCVPMVLTVTGYYGAQLISVFMAGHLGQLQLAASTLANSWSVVSGQSVMVGLSGAMDTLCGQAYGAKQYKMMGIYLQANCIISFFLATLISVSWFFSEHIFIALHQHPDIAREAGVYLKHLIPVIFEYSILFNLTSFLQTQSLVIPLVVCSATSLLLHFGIVYALVFHTSLGFRGAAVASSISIFLLVFMLCCYVLCSKRLKNTWCGFSSQALCYVLSNLKLALPSAGMVCLEYCAFEILVMLAGIMPNPVISTSVIAMCVNTSGFAFLISYGLSAAASTRVSNELGAGNIGGAKRAMGVTLKLAILVVLLIDFGLGMGRNQWARLFTNSPLIIKEFGALTPFLLMSMTFDYVQCVLSGVARGAGWQRTVVFFNLTSYYLVGMLISILLGFIAKLQIKGLWIGIVCGSAFQASCLVLLTMRTKWDAIKFITSKPDHDHTTTTSVVQIESQASKSMNSNY